MKKIFALLCCFLICFSAFASSDLIYSINAKHFQIIYPEECSQTASLVYEKCEEIYEEIKKITGYSGEKIFIPVVIRNDVQNLNAYYTGYPYHMIVLYDTAADESTDFNQKEKMVDIFRHELTHAMLFNRKSSAWQKLGNAFSDAISPQALYVNPLLSEGLAVYSESIDGYGRNNSSSFTQKIKQSKYEGIFPSWKRASGGIDRGYLYDSSYSFGGPFIEYLANTYGQGKIRELFTKTSGLYFNDMNKAFINVFGKNADELWYDFYDSIEIDEYPVVSQSISGYGKYTVLFAKDQYIYALNTANSSVEKYDAYSCAFESSMPSYGASSLFVCSDDSLLLG